MRLFVVCGDPPDASSIIAPSTTFTTPQPPGPGFPEQAPSVNTPVWGPPRTTEDAALPLLVVPPSRERPLGRPPRVPATWVSLLCPLPALLRRQSLQRGGVQPG